MAMFGTKNWVKEQEQAAQQEKIKQIEKAYYDRSRASQLNPEQFQLPSIKLERLGGDVEQAQRQQLARDLMVQQQAAQRQLAAQQARTGIRGGAAAAQQSRIQQQVEQQRAVGEEQGLTQRTLYNLEQAQKEQFANVAQQVAMKQILASLQGQQMMAEAAEKGAKVQAETAEKTSHKIICGELYKQGYLDDVTFKADADFGKIILHQDPELMLGYWRLAVPIVNLMRRSKVFTFVVSLIAKPWAKHMSYMMGIRKKPHMIGKLIHSLGQPLCRYAARKVKAHA